jgi:hypothetical protein
MRVPDTLTEREREREELCSFDCEGEDLKLGRGEGEE